MKQVIFNLSQIDDNAAIVNILKNKNFVIPIIFQRLDKGRQILSIPISIDRSKLALIISNGLCEYAGDVNTNHIGFMEGEGENFIQVITYANGIPCDNLLNNTTISITLF